MKGDANQGRLKIEWARRHMPVLEGIRHRFEAEKPLQGLTLSCVLHVEAKTCALALALKAGGAIVHLAAGNPLSTDDDPVTAAREDGIDIRAEKGESLDDYLAGIRAMAAADPDIIIDDGADLVALLHSNGNRRGKIRGSTEETTTGITRVRALEHSRKLLFPVIDVNDADTKHFFDNRYGTGQSVLDGVLSATNLLIAGKVCVVAGYGWCGRGIAARLRGMGGDVVVTEVDPVRALEARLEGYRVKAMIDAAPEADLIVTATGNTGVVRSEHFRILKNGCLLANAGHFDIEVSRRELEAIALSHRTARANVEEYRFADGRAVYLLGEGRLVNLAAGQGHPVEIMDLSFALQALSVEHLAKAGWSMEPKLHTVPRAVDIAVAEAALAPLGARIDTLREEQASYNREWDRGTA